MRPPPPLPPLLILLLHCNQTKGSPFPSAQPDVRALTPLTPPPRPACNNPLPAQGWHREAFLGGPLEVGTSNAWQGRSHSKWRESYVAAFSHG